MNISGILVQKSESKCVFCNNTLAFGYSMIVRSWNKYHDQQTSHTERILSWTFTYSTQSHICVAWSFLTKCFVFTYAHRVIHICAESNWDPSVTFFFNKSTIQVLYLPKGESKRRRWTVEPSFFLGKLLWNHRKKTVRYNRGTLKTIRFFGGNLSPSLQWTKRSNHGSTKT